MNRKTRITLVLAGALALASGSALAFGPGKSFCDRHGGPGLHAAYHLDDLTPEQRSAIDQLRDELRADFKAQRETMREQRKALHEAIQSGADEASLRPLAQQQAKKMEDMILRRAEVHRKLNAILTPEQQQQLKERAAERRERRDS